MRQEILLGVDKENCIVFAEVEIYQDRNGKKYEFTMSCDAVHPFNGTMFDLNDYMEGWVGSLDDRTKIELLERFDCKPSDLASELINDDGDIRTWIDCSLYPDYITIDGDDWYFESYCCCQHDPRGSMKKIINVKLFNKLFDFWDNYHLKEITDEQFEEVSKLIDALYDTYDDEQEWIADYIHKNIDDFI